MMFSSCMHLSPFLIKKAVLILTINMRANMAYLLEGKHLVLHCRGGIGRSSLMAANVLILLGFSPEQAFELISSARGCPVPETQEQLAWAVAFAHANRAD